MAGDKQYEVIREFRRTDPQTGVDTYHDIGDPYTGPIDDGYLDPQGIDDYGPLLVDKAERDAAEKAIADEKKAHADKVEKAAAAAEKDAKAAADKADADKAALEKSEKDVAAKSATPAGDSTKEK